jgi:putative transposase
MSDIVAEAADMASLVLTCGAGGGWSDGAAGSSNTTTLSQKATFKRNRMDFPVSERLFIGLAAMVTLAKSLEGEVRGCAEIAMGPELAIADGALGFWQAVEEVWPKTRGQRCWVHKTANVLNKLPTSQQSKAKRALQEVWMAETKKDALAAFEAFAETWAVKYDKAVACVTKDREALLAFYDFPAEHWKHLRTSNVIESSFATIRHRTVRSKGCLSNKTALAMIFKLAQAAEKTWRRLDGHNQLPKVILGVTFTDGIEVVRSQAQAAAA